MRHSPDSLLASAEAEVFSRLKKLTRPRQSEVLAVLARGSNVFASLPTGYGKSVCFWAPAAAWGWRVWVVSPLVSLIQDQAMATAAMGLNVASWHGGISPAERERLEDSMLAGEAQICFLSPERLLWWKESGFLSRLVNEGSGPDLLALDEMHCFEEWRGFREGYDEAFAPVRRLAQNGVQILGLSASLSLKEAKAWMEELCDTHEFVGEGLGRENLSLFVREVETEEERWLWLISALRELGPEESALVYCATRAETDDVTRWLCSAGLPAVAYHAGLPAAWREARSRGFRAGALRIVCATSAFGMGVDFPRVRRVIHFSLPYSLESYWQEAGRAGRDGEEAFSLALWRRSEIRRARQMSEAERERFAALWHAWAEGSCRKIAVAHRLGMEQAPCGKCDRCLVKHENFPACLRENYLLGREAWWTQAAAELGKWAKQKIFDDHT